MTTNDMYLQLDDKQRKALIRLLAALAKADGFIDPMEQDFLTLFMGTPDPDLMESEIKALPAPTTEDFEVLGGPNAETIYWLCSVLVCTDEHVDEKELPLLANYAKSLKIKAEKVSTLDANARQEVLERHCRKVAAARDDKVRRATSLSIIADQLGVPAAEVKRLREQYSIPEE